MGEVREAITLVNLKDFVNNGYADKPEVRQLTVTALVDTGSMRLVIGEETRKGLGLAIMEERTATLAGNVKIPCKVTEPVFIRWKDRYTTTHALVLADKEEVLMGVIPLEDMDLKVNPAEGRLEGAHGDEWAQYIR